MTAVTYTAKRELITGHTADTEYTIDLRCVAIDRGKDVGKESPQSMSGNSETVMWRNLKTRKVTTAALVGDELLLVREFLESVIAGEAFQFDEFGTASASDDPMDVVMPGIYSENRAVRQGDGGADDHFRFSFSIRQTP